MTPQEQHKELIQQLEKLKNNLARAEGVISQLEETLLKEHNCKSIAESKALLSKLKEEKAETLSRFEAAQNEFRREYASRLET